MIALAFVVFAGSAHAAVLYKISSFNNDNSDTGGGVGIHWVAGITTISTASGLSSTIVSIPEPSSALLGDLAALGFVIRCRR